MTDSSKTFPICDKPLSKMNRKELLEVINYLEKEVEKYKSAFYDSMKRSFVEKLKETS